MILGQGRCRLGLLLATALLAVGATAVGRSPAFDEPARDAAPSVESGPALTAEGPNHAVLREYAYMHVKQLGLPPEEAFEALDEIDARAWHGEIADEAIERTTWVVMDRDFSQKIAFVLRRYAEAMAFGSPMAIRAPSERIGDYEMPALDPAPGRGASTDEPGFDSLSSGSAGQPSGLEGWEIGLGSDVDPLRPSTHACADAAETVCEACVPGGAGILDFPCTVPTCTPQEQCGDLGTVPVIADCAWHCFTVTEGKTYQFDTCATDAHFGGTFNVNLQLWTDACNQLIPAAGAQNLDNCGPVPVNRGESITYVPNDGDINLGETFGVYLRVQKVAAGISPSTNSKYVLTYKEVCICPTCATPVGPPVVPPASGCQCLAAAATDPFCLSDFYSFSLTAGRSYKFTLCGATCPLASANYDSLLRLFGPPTGCAGSALATSNDECGLQDEITFNATVTGLYVLEVTGDTLGSVTFSGEYRLCVVDVTCPGSCATPLGTLTPSCATGDCVEVSGTVTACQDNWYTVMLSPGQTYAFSTTDNPLCNPACEGSVTGLDSVVKLFTPGCPVNEVDLNDDCNPLELGSYFEYTVPAIPTGGPFAYRVHVSGSLSDTGNFTLAVGCLQSCTAPSNVTILPPSGTFPTNDPGACKRTQTFVVSAQGDTPMTFTTTVTVTSGNGSASVTSPNPFVTGTGGGNVTVEFTNDDCGDVTYRVNVTASNACGSASAFVDHRVHDATPPVIAPIPPVFAECGDPSTAPPTVTATDNCDPNPTVTRLADIVSPGSCAGNSVTIRRWQARDCNGNDSLIATQVVTVTDTTPPSVMPGNDIIACLWSPHHDYLCLDLAELNPQVTGPDCSGPGVTFSLGGVMSSECDDGPCDTTDGNGDGSTENDVCPVAGEILGQQTFCIRAERQGTGVGRDYTVFVIAQDACGNTSAPVGIGRIHVPHDQDLHPECLEPNAGRVCGEVVCDNEIDGDEDGLVDCADPDCADDPFCNAP